MFEKLMTLAERYVDACERLADASAESARHGLIHAANASRIAAAQERAAERINVADVVDETVRVLEEKYGLITRPVPSEGK